MIRRDFVKNGAAFCAAASLPAILKAKNVNDKIGIALIGARRMGWDDPEMGVCRRRGRVRCDMRCRQTHGAKEGGRSRKNSGQTPVRVRRLPKVARTQGR